MLEQAIITSCSNKFFPSVVNLLGSIKNNYPNHPKIFVYDLGLLWFFRKELESIENVEVLDFPSFVSFWRSCYTWKTYIFSHPLARLNFYLDAGCQVLKPLNLIFEEINSKDLFVINQGVKFKDIVPQDYKSIFEIGIQFDEDDTIHAGEFGFKANSTITKPLENVYQSAVAGLALGFSQGDSWRNKGKDKNYFVRDCKIFRHDMTLLNIWIKKYFGNKIFFNDVHEFAGGKNTHPDQVIANIRLNFKKLDFLDPNLIHKKIQMLTIINRLIIATMIKFKNINLSLKRKFGIVK